MMFQPYHSEYVNLAVVRSSIPYLTAATEREPEDLVMVNVVIG